MDGNVHDDGGTPQNCPSVNLRSRTVNGYKCHPEEVIISSRMHIRKVLSKEIEPVYYYVSHLVTSASDNFVRLDFMRSSVLSD